MTTKRKSRYAKPGTPPPSPDEVDRMVGEVGAAVLALREAQYQVRIASAERDLARAQAHALRVHADLLQRQIDKRRGSK